MRKFLVIIFVLLLAGIGYAQFDPGERDTVYFCGVKSYVYGPPYSGRIKIDVCFFNDENLAGVDVPLRWGGPVSFDSGSFLDSRVITLGHKIAILYDTTDEILVQAVAIPPGPDYIGKGSGRLVSLMGTANDTGALVLDTTSMELHEFTFFDGDGFQTPFIPVFQKLEYHIQADSTKPGDIYQNGNVALEVIISLVNYIFRNGILNFKPAADVNSDCMVNLTDIEYLVNYIFKGGTPPIPGCAWD